MSQTHQRPSADKFIDFSLYGGDRKSHPVHKWLVAQPSYVESLRRLPHRGQDLDFAQRVSYCLGHYYATMAGKLWKRSGTRKRAAAARDYQKALGWCRSGFGPYASEDAERLAELLTTARDYVLGKHASPGFRMKAGEHQPVGMLIRELVVFLDMFDFPSRSLNPAIVNLISLADTDVNERTVERHVRAYKKALKATDQ